MHTESAPTTEKQPRAPRPAATFGRGAASGIVLLAACAGLSASAAPASVARAAFHTALEATFPASDSVHRDEVDEVRLRFSTPIQLALSTVRILGADSTAVPTQPLDTVPASEGREIRTRLLAPLANGSYTVRWTTAGPDSHPLSGSFAFGVDRPGSSGAPISGGVVTGDPPLTSAFAAENAGEARDPVGALIRSLFLLSILGMLGSSAFRLAVLRPLAGDPLLEPTVLLAADQTRGLAAAAAGLAFASVPMRLWSQSAELFGANALGAYSLGRIIASPWGTAWMFQTAMAALFVAGLVGVGHGDRRTRGWWIMLAAAVGSAVVPALSGHALATAGRSRTFAVVNDALHVTAAGAWMGTLAVMLIVGVPAVLSREPKSASGAAAAGPIPPLARMVNAFSRLAMVAVAALVVTGLVNAWLQLGSLDALLRSAYGVTLLAKLALVGAAASVGLYNWRVVRPALAQGDAAGRLRVTVTTETVLGLMIVLVTAILMATPLPGP
jgi:putative copper export protein/methionine-rich copper-binding protein CopC